MIFGMGAGFAIARHRDFLLLVIGSLDSSFVSPDSIEQSVIETWRGLLLVESDT